MDVPVNWRIDASVTRVIEPVYEAAIVASIRIVAIS
jgi:hypothetical protein